MSILDVIPFTLFRMLSSPAHARNVAVLERIFEQFFDDFAFAPKKAEVLQVIQEVLDNPDYRTLPETKSEPQAYPSNAKASPRRPQGTARPLRMVFSSRWPAPQMRVPLAPCRCTERPRRQSADRTHRAREVQARPHSAVGVPAWP